MEKAGCRTLWEGQSMEEAPISDEDINKHILSYKK